MIGMYRWLFLVYLILRNLFGMLLVLSMIRLW